MKWQEVLAKQLTRSELLLVVCIAASLTVVAAPKPASAQDEPAAIETFTLGVTGDLANLPWIIAQRRGDLARLESQYSLRLDILRFPGEDDAIGAFARGDIDAVTSSFPAMLESIQRSDRDAQLVLLTGFSRGGYGIVSRVAKNPNALRGEPIHLAIGSGSHYLLFRILERANIALSEVDLVDRPERVLTQAIARGEIETAAIGGSGLAQVSAMDELTLVADSRSLGGELVNGMMVDSAVLEANPNLGHMLTDGWFSIMASLSNGNGSITAQGHDSVLALSGLPTTVLSRYLTYIDFLTQPNHVKNLMRRGNLRRVTAAVARFRQAAGLYTCPDAQAGSCIAFESDDIIANSAGVQLRLNTQFIEQFIARQIDDAR